jgi:hypothetical protein
MWAPLEGETTPPGTNTSAVMEERKTTLINETFRSPSPSRREQWLAGSVLLAWAVLLVPSLVISPDRQPGFVPIAQFSLCGLLLGVGRQGIDVLALRVLLVAPMVVIEVIVGRHLHASFPLCSDSQGVTCIQSLTVAVLFGGFSLAIILAAIAIPTTILWRKGVRHLRPELPWSRVPKPKTWEGWVLLAVVLLFGLPILLGIPYAP